jgi:hypothetical protein
MSLRILGHGYIAPPFLTSATNGGEQPEAISGKSGDCGGWVMTRIFAAQEATCGSVRHRDAEH